MTTDAVGGVWQYALDLAAGITRRGAEILLATLGPPPSAAQRQQAKAIAGLTLAEGDFPLEWEQNPWSGVDASGKWLLQLQANYGADLAHLNGYSHAALPWKIPVITVAHSCVFSWWRAVHGTAPGTEWTEYRRRVTEGLKAAPAIVAPTIAMARNLSHEYGIPIEKVKTIANFSLASPTMQHEKQPLILSAGRIWDVAKNLKRLSGLAPQLRWKLRIADGTLPHAELLNEMTRAGIFGHPSLYEPFGLAVLEAARSRCCLVLSDIPSLRELWDGAAVFINPRDEQEWVRQLNKLAENEERRNSLAALAFARSKRYDAAQSLQEYWTLYGKLIINSHKKTGEAAA